MNKEEFKQVIINQFRNGVGAINALMYAANNKNEYNFKFHNCGYFTNSDLGLDFIITRIPDTYDFEVQFADDCHLQKDISLVTFVDIGFPLGQTLSRIAIERMSIAGSEIIMSLSQYDFKAKDYEFSLVPVANKCQIVKFDMKKEKFIFGSPTELSDECMKQREQQKNKLTYVDYLIDKKDYLQMDKITEKLKVSTLMKHNVMNAFSSLPSRKCSAMTDVIQKLIDHENRIQL